MKSAAASRPARQLLSISHLTVLDAAPPELVTAAADAGFDAAGIRVWPAADEPAYPVLGDTLMMRETIARLADTGTRVLDVEVLRLRPDSQMDGALRILDAGALLQARAVLVICNDPEEDRLVDRFAAVCEAAGERGLQACLEFMIFSSVKTIADAAWTGRATRRVPSWWIRCTCSGPEGRLPTSAPRHRSVCPTCNCVMARSSRSSRTARWRLPRHGPEGCFPAMVSCRWLSFSAHYRRGRRWPWRRRSPTWPEGRPTSGPAWPMRPSPGCLTRRSRPAIRLMRGSGTPRRRIGIFGAIGPNLLPTQPMRGAGPGQPAGPGIPAPGQTWR